MDEKDYRVDIKVRNNRILSLIERNGYKNVLDFCKKNNLNASIVGCYINMRRVPITPSTGKYAKPAIDIAECLGVGVDELFSQDQLHCELKTNKSHFTASKEDVMYLMASTGEQAIENDPHQLRIQEEIKSKTDEMLNGLTPREQKVIEMRLGLNGNKDHTLEEVGHVLDVTRVRVRQIEAQALRKLRQPSRSGGIRDLLETSRNRE